jgi:RNA-directed DNA polymerase
MNPANLLTKRHWIVELARKKPGEVLFSLHHVIDFEWMREAYWLTRKDGATGIDGMTAQEYEANLEANLKDLRERIISGRYKAPPVRRAYIPKADGSQRPLGIPTFEDKVAQRAIAMVLEAVYEQDFLSCSYGFRPGRSAHQALRQLSGATMVRRQYWVLDVDIRKYFDSIPHRELRAILDQRVTDGVIRRMIGKWLKAGVLEDGLTHYATEGTPQGGVISPILSNIFLHHVLDVWFENEVRPRLSGRDPGAVCRRLRDDLRDPPRRQTGTGSAGETAWSVWAHAASRQDALHRLPPAAPRGHACRLQGPSVRLPRLHPHMGKVAERQERSAANNGQEPLCPCAARGQGLVPSQSASADPRSARPAVCQARRSLCLLRHHGELSQAAAVSPRGHDDVAQVARATHALEAAPVGSLQRVPRPPPAASGQDCPPLCHLERSSPVKNRMREFRTSGSVRGEGDNILTYSDLQAAGD